MAKQPAFAYSEDSASAAESLSHSPARPTSRVVRSPHPVVAGAEACMVVWQSDPVSVVGLASEVSLGTAYVVAARRARGRRSWPRSASAAFLAGLGALAVVLQSGLAAYDENYAVHVVQHVVLMSIAPLLLALGAPVTLLLRVA